MPPASPLPTPPPSTLLMSSNKPLLLIKNSVDPEGLAQIGAHFEIINAPTPERFEQAIIEAGHRAEVVLTNGATGLSAAQIDALPRLKLICSMGVGHENIALAHAKARGIAVTNGAGTNDSCVADHAMGLILAIVRGIPRLDRLTREGVWRSQLTLPPNVSGKQVDILGLGAIGEKIAQRAQGFDMPIGYHNRRPRPDSTRRYFDSLEALADWADILVVAIPGGADSHHRVNANILERLGPAGYLINIARGSVVDTAALEQALRLGRLAGAGLDVYEGEPKLPSGLADLENIVLTPHVAGWSPEAVQRTIDKFLENARRFYAGEPLLTPI
ncbi:2-hydroxyacid dehydrogenase [Bordetella avium]|nr:2-hydroxyacid dehydrogenase [Bordetella avium]